MPSDVDDPDAQVTRAHRTCWPLGPQTAPVRLMPENFPTEPDATAHHHRRRQRRYRRPRYRRRRHPASAGVAVVVSTTLDTPAAARRLDTPGTLRTWLPTLPRA